MLSSNGVPPEKAGGRQWKATDRGFQKVEQTVTLDEIGRELALQTLAKAVFLIQEDSIRSSFSSFWLQTLSEPILDVPAMLCVG